MLDQLIDYRSRHPRLAAIAWAVILTATALLGTRFAEATGLAPSLRDLAESILDEAASHRWVDTQGVDAPPRR
jgi:hypothetical protein